MKILSCFDRGNFDNQAIIKPYIIAEAGVNHEGSMETARRLIEEAKEGGADAIKFQTYRASTIASKNSPAYWDLTKEKTESQYKLFKKYEGFWQVEFEQLKRACDDIEIEFMSTPFDIESAKFLSDLMDVFKISSSDITNKPFIEFLCEFRKPIILSTGASYLYEIEEAVGWITSTNTTVALLHCVLNYPTLDCNANLGMIKSLQKKFPGHVVGYSDHTLPGDMSILETATLLGASILEKHFTHDKTLPGNDHYHAMDKHDLAAFRSRLNRVFSLLGKQNKLALDEEKPARQHARRSLVASCDIPAGVLLEDRHLTWKRPAHGVSPKYIDSVIGMVTSRDLKEDEVIQWESLQGRGESDGLEGE